MHKRGFSLIEMSVVLLIIGSMAGGMLTMANKKVEQNKYDITQDHLLLIDNALTAYAVRGHILPCPASSDAALNSANFGVADNCAAAAPVLSGIIAANPGGSDEVWVGAVPTRALDLPDSVMFDGWGNRIRYAVVKSLASSVESFENFTATVSGMTTGLQINDGFGNPLTDITGLNVAAYAIISFGKDMDGARTRIGTSIPVACPSASAVKSQENCDDDSLFVDAAYNDGAVAANYFDDLVRWKSWYRISPVEQPALPAFIPNIISIGQVGGCAVNDQSQLVCWGTNQFGTIGINNKNYAYSIPQPTGTAGTGTNFTDWEKVSVDGRIVCGIRNGGELWCWGRNGMAQTGNGVGSGYPCNETSTCTEHLIVPTRIGTATDWVSASPGGCGIRSDGRAYCWGGCPGDNATSCAGDDSLFNNTINTFVAKTPVEIHTDSTSATPNVTFTDWVKIDKHGRDGCGLRANGEIWCWGLNATGSAGDGTISNPNTGVNQRRGAVKISGGCQGNFSSVYNSGEFACGICRTGEAYCWGSNSQGELGAGLAPYCPTTGGCTTKSNQWEPGAPQPDFPIAPYYESVPFNPTTSSSNPVTQTASQTNTIGAAYFKLTPQLVSGGHSWSTLTLAGDTACGITTDGHAYCWGDNINGISGTSGPDTNIPKEVSGNYSTWVDIGMGQKNICGSRADKKLYCWGDGWYCDLGAGESTANPASDLPDTQAKCADRASPNAVYNLTLPF